MKKTFKLLSFIAAIASFAMFQSCKEDEATPAKPTLTAPATVASVQVGAKADVTFTFTAPGKYKSSSVVATGGTATVKTAPAADSKSGSVVVEFTAGNTAGAGTVTLTLVDQSNQEIEEVAVLNVSISAPPSIVLTATSGSADPGETLQVTANITAANGASTLTITGVTTTPTSPIAITGTAPSQLVTMQIPADAVPESEILVVFTAKDAQNLNSTAVTYTITVTDPTIVLEGTLTTQTLDANESYLLKSQVFVPNGVTLTIPAGTVVKGDKATKGTLIVRPGGVLIAEGTSTNPIVFTSNQPVGGRDRGDWGGIVMLGNAFVNQATKPKVEGVTPDVNYGSSIAESATPTTNATENSGKLKYVRIEYGGIELLPNSETNSLTLGAVGNGTTVEYVQTSFGGDDAFEWFGGTVNAKYLVSHSTWDDDFDTDFGWSGNVQWGVVVRNPFYADQSGSNAFESDNQGNGNTVAGLCDLSVDGTTGTTNGCTRGVFSNITVLGPRNTNSLSISNNYDNTLHIRRRSSISIFNSFFSGFRKGLRVDDAGTWHNINNGQAVFENNVLSITPNVGVATSATATEGTFLTGITFALADDGSIDGAVAAGRAASVANKWNLTNSVFNNVTTAAQISELGIDHANLYWGTKTSSTYPSNPNFTLLAGVSGANNLNDGEAFTHAKLTGGFFTTVTYRGAFGATDWTDGWSEFQPLNKAY